MGRCYLEMGEHDKAKQFGEKSSEKAIEANDMMWQLNATVLVAQAEGKVDKQPNHWLYLIWNPIIC